MYPYFSHSSSFGKAARWLLLSFLFASPLIAQSEVMQLDFARAVNLQQDVALPHVWSHDPEGMMGVVHYRLTFPRPATSKDLQAVYVPFLNMAGRIHLNGQLIGNSGFAQEPLGRYFYTPQLYSFPASLYQTGDNILDIELQASANRFGELAPVSIGDQAQLLPLFERNFFAHDTVQVISSALSAIFVLLLLPVWWVRRQSLFGWFIGGCLAWSINGLNFFVHNIPVPTPLWEWLVFTCVGLIPLCFSIFIFRLIGLNLRRLENSVLLVSLIFVLALAVETGRPVFFSIASMWHGLLLLLGLYALLHLFRHLWRQRDWSVIYIGFSLLLVCLLAIHDLVVRHWGTSNQNGIWFSYAGPLLLTAMGLLMVRQFLKAVQTTEALNVTLESRVATAQGKLAESYAELRVLEMESAVQNERERIYRNLHDDVGAKLLGLLISAQRSNQTRETDLARSALRDLREVVSRTANSSISLANLVADWHAETEQRTSAAQLSLKWESAVQEWDAIIVTPDAALNLSRILREAINNILRHAGASHVCVSVRLEDSFLTLDVADNGVGILPDSTSNRGMDSMQARAIALKGVLHVRNSVTQGCAVHLQVPSASLSSTEPTLGKTAFPNTQG